MNEETPVPAPRLGIKIERPKEAGISPVYYVLAGGSALFFLFSILVALLEITGSGLPPFLRIPLS